MPLDPEWWANGPTDPFRDNTNGDITAATFRTFSNHVSTRIDNGGPVYVVDHIGAIGPGFDILHDLGVGMFEDPSINWGPDYYLYQTPWSTWGSIQAEEGQTLACAAYLDADVAPDVAQEVIWKVVDGAWQVDGTRPVTPGTTVTCRNPLEIEWLVGTLFVVDGEGRMELANMQQTRSHIARMSAIRTVSSDGNDEDDSGNPWGTIIVDTSVDDVVRVLPELVYPGREIVYINKGTGILTVEAPAGSSLYGASTVDQQYGWLSVVFDGADWYSRTGSYA